MLSVYAGKKIILYAHLFPGTSFNFTYYFTHLYHQLIYQSALWASAVLVSNISFLPQEINKKYGENYSLSHRKSSTSFFVPFISEVAYLTQKKQVKKLVPYMMLPLSLVYPCLDIIPPTLTHRESFFQYHQNLYRTSLHGIHY
ncbi:hypothetical protein ACJX0J_009797, partial [Zea mays]